MYILLALGSAVTAALVAIFGKIGLKEVDATLATTLRGVLMGIFMLLISLILISTGKISWANPSPRSWLFIALAALAGAASWTFYFWALKTGTAGSVAAIDRTSIVFTLILAALFLGEGLTLKTALGGLLVALGAILIVLK